MWDDRWEILAIALFVAAAWGIINWLVPDPEAK